MQLYLFEGRTAGTEAGNWGKFAVGIPDAEWKWRSRLGAPEHEERRDRLWPLLREQGWGPRHIWVMDLATGEGAIFQHGGNARADLSARRIWVCVLFEAFLQWLYRQDLRLLGELPPVVELDVPVELSGYRRPGFWYDRGSGALRVMPGPGVCVGICLAKRALASSRIDNA